MKKRRFIIILLFVILLSSCDNFFKEEDISETKKLQEPKKVEKIQENEFDKKEKDLTQNTLVDNGENSLDESKNKVQENTQVQEKNQIEENFPKNLTKAKVVKHVDGDTVYIMLENGEEYKVRFIGIDTPETRHPSKGVEPYGKEASEYTKNNLLNTTVYLEKDISDIDRYGRLLRYIWLPSAIGKVNFENPSLEDVKEYMFNGKLVAEGYAQSSSYPPDVKYQDYFLELNRAARESEIGLWNPDLVLNEENNIVDQPVKIEEPVKTEETVNEEITEKIWVDENGRGLIKGNINRKGEKIYHLPDGQYYEKTKINEEKGERWFKTESEAINAGWRKSKR